MAKVCEGCGREFEDRSVRCPICKRGLVSVKGGGWEGETIEWVQLPERQELDRQDRRDEKEQDWREEPDRQDWLEERELDGQSWREERGQTGPGRQRPRGGQTGQRHPGGRTGRVQGVRTWQLQGVEARAAQRRQSRPVRSAGQVQGVQTWHLPAAEARALQRQPARPAGQEQGVQTWHLPGVEARAAQRQQERREQSAQEQAMREYARRRRGQAAQEQAMQEQARREQAVQEQAVQEQAMREEIRRIEDWEEDLYQDLDLTGEDRAEEESGALSREIFKAEQKKPSIIRIIVTGILSIWRFIRLRTEPDQDVYSGERTEDRYYGQGALATIYFQGGHIHGANRFTAYIDGKETCSFDGGSSYSETIMSGEHKIAFKVYNSASKNEYWMNPLVCAIEAGETYDCYPARA